MQIAWLAPPLYVKCEAQHPDSGVKPISRFQDQPAAVLFKNKLERQGLPVYTHRFTKGYPTDVEAIVSDLRAFDSTCRRC